MNNIKGAIFDMDGTLIDSLIVWNEIWDAIGERYGKKGFRPSDEDDKAIRTMTLSTCCDFIHQRYDLGSCGKELYDYMNEICEVFYAERVLLKDGVTEFLDHLASKGVKMIVATATALDLVMIAYRRCGLDKYFSEVISCATIGKGKDQPDIYLLALEKLGTPKEETWVFEDSATAVVTASKIGLPTVGIYDDYNYGQDVLQSTANYYIAKGETLEKLI